MIQVFEGAGADEVWQKGLTAFQSVDFPGDQPSRGGRTHEILHAAIAIADPRQRWILSRSPALNPAFAIVETIWIVRGRDDSAFVNYFNTQLSKYAGGGSAYHGAYGSRLRRHFGIDQLDRAYRVLRHSPNSRQVVLQLWDAQSDLPNAEGVPADLDIPCNVISMLKVRNGKLEWTQIMRSNDFFLGLPHNIIQFTTLQEVIAGWLEVEVGAYHHFSDSLHLYHHDILKLGNSARITVPKNDDDLALPKEVSDRWFGELEDRVNMVIDTSMTSEQISRLLDWPSAPSAFRNMLCIVIAEGLRRRGDAECARHAVDSCSNEVFRSLWNRWTERVIGKKIEGV